MIKLKRGNMRMEVRTEVQASAFLKAGYEIVDENEKTTETKNRAYKKSDISRMSTEDLKNLAIGIGLDVTEESTGKMLKEEIIAELEL